MPAGRHAFGRLHGNDTMSAKLISITGLPAAGKTTLAEALAGELPARIVYEDYAGNPFLAQAYAGDARACLGAQIHYLISRVEQLARWTWPAEGLVVSDYGFCQDRIYARSTLSDVDWDVYIHLADRLAPRVQPPAVIVHLEASDPLLLARIARRGRDFERGIDAGFLSAMREAYNDIEARVDCSVIRVDCDATDLRGAAARAELIRKIRETL